MKRRKFRLEWEPYEAQQAFAEDTSPNVGFVGGLGAGKTLSGWVKALQMTPDDGVGIIVAPTYPMLRDVVLATFQEHFSAFGAELHRSDMSITLVSGTKILLRSATHPERCKGINAGWIWFDEAALMSRRALIDIGGRARVGAQRIWWTTTPIKGVGVYSTYVETGIAKCYHARSEDNPYLSPAYVAAQRAVMSDKEARRELDAEWVDAGGVLWEQEAINANRRSAAPGLTRYVIGVDPATTAKQRSDQTGIVVVGQDTAGHAYVLADHSGQYAMHEWARVVCELSARYSALVVCETNAGGDLVERNIRMHDPAVPYRGVRAGASKSERAAPIATLYRSGWVHHVGVHRDLERQMTTWEPSDPKSPDRLDALVWAVTELQIYPHAPSPDRIERTAQRKVRI
jgi:phage terminase large subunit-like protein